jgi:hypothetical protein
MNDETARLLFDVTGRLQRSIQQGDCPAIVALDGQPATVLSDYDYLRDEETATAFELRAAARARETGTRRWVLAVPQVWVTRAGLISTRAVSNLPLRDGEQEAITWMSFDDGDGVDYGRVFYTRRPHGEPVFDEPEIFTASAQVRPSPSMPGYTLLRALTADGGEDTAGH